MYNIIVWLSVRCINGTVGVRIAAADDAVLYSSYFVFFFFGIKLSPVGSICIESKCETIRECKMMWRVDYNNNNDDAVSRINIVNYKM